MAQIVKESGEVFDVVIEDIKQMQDIVKGFVIFTRGIDGWIVASKLDAKDSGYAKNHKASRLAGVSIYGTIILFERYELY